MDIMKVWVLNVIVLNEVSSWMMNFNPLMHINMVLGEPKFWIEFSSQTLPVLKVRLSLDTTHRNTVPVYGLEQYKARILTYTDVFKIRQRDEVLVISQTWIIGLWKSLIILGTRLTLSSSHNTYCNADGLCQALSTKTTTWT